MKVKTGPMGRMSPVLLILFFLLAFPLHARTAEIQPSSGMDVEPEPPKAYVEVKDSLLSVELLNAEFGSVMKEIAQKAGFQVDISRDVSVKRLSTSFENLQMEKGILRLLTLIREKNYSIYYNPETGLIKEVRVMGGQTTVSPVQKTAPLRPVQPDRALPQQQPQGFTGQSQEEIEEIENMMGEPYPYIPPKEQPQYIPPPE